MTNSKTTTSIWVGQPVHFICLTLLLAMVYFAWNYIGEPFPAFFWCTVAVPVVHQIFVWLAWRLEIRSEAISKTISFHGYVVIFFVLFAGRFISMFTLAWADRGSLNLTVVPATILTILLALPGIYAMCSVQRYFGMARAAGGDHFDKRYLSMPFVNKGIFRFTHNGMYLYAFLLFWAFAVGFNSSASLIAAAFSHMYIWVHFYATEKPDIAFLYGAADKQVRSDASEPHG